MEARQVRVPQQRMRLGRRRVGGSAREPAKISRPESARAKFERNSVGGSVRGANPLRFSILSAHQSFVLSFPLFRLSRSEAPPADSEIRTRRETSDYAQQSAARGGCR